MQNKLISHSLSTLRIIAISSLTIFTLYSLQAWVGPTLSAPNGNVGGPLTTSTTTQIKTGSLGLLDSLSIGKNLIVNGGFRFATTSAGLGKVLTSDASGNGSWTATSSLGISGGTLGASTAVVIGGQNDAGSGWNGSCPSGYVLTGMGLWSNTLHLQCAQFR